MLGTPHPCAPPLAGPDETPDPATIRRHVFYLEGYDPQGIPGYHALFRREYARWLTVWPLSGHAGAAATDPDGITGRWDIETTGPDWHVATTYTFLRWDDIILRDMAQSIWTRPWRAARLFADFTGTFTTARIFDAYWRFGCFFCYPFLAHLLIFVLAIVAGFVTFDMAGAAGLAAPLALGAAASVALLTFIGSSHLSQRWFVIQLTEMWLFMRDHLDGRRPDMEQRLDAFADRIADALAHDDADEVVLVSHSCGGLVAPDLLRRLLKRTEMSAQPHRKVIWLSLGSIMPAAALHPAATRLRDDLAALASDPRIVWIECQAWDDFVNAWAFDPVLRLPLRLDAARCNPIMVDAPFREMLSAGNYRRFCGHVFRMHFQFIMANDRRAPYDVFMMLCGPAPLTRWATDGAGTVAAFAPDGAYTADPVNASTQLPTANPA